jgi:hypothetical protein
MVAAQVTVHRTPYTPPLDVSARARRNGAEPGVPGGTPTIRHTGASLVDSGITRLAGGLNAAAPGETSVGL